MGHVEPPGGNAPGPERPLWVTFLKYMGVVVGVVFVVAIVFVGFIFFTCTRH